MTVSATGCEGIYEWKNSSNVLWSQVYQNTLMTNNLMTICDYHSGVTVFAVSAFADYKGNDAAQKTCGPCKFKPGTHDAIDINVKCDGMCGLMCKPCGKSHMGVVDYWRRPKDLYATWPAVHCI